MTIICNKYFSSLIFLVLFFNSIYAQQSKPIIDSAAVNHLPSLSDSRAISDDGRLFIYGIGNQPVGSRTMMVKSTEGSWQKGLL